jgi:hypothetical protein
MHIEEVTDIDSIVSFLDTYSYKYLLLPLYAFPSHEENTHFLLFLGIK